MSENKVIRPRQGEIEASSIDLISHLLTSERKMFRALAMVNNGGRFEVYAKDNGKVLLSIQRRTGGFIAHLGSAVEKRDIRLIPRRLPVHGSGSWFSAERQHAMQPGLEESRQEPGRLWSW